MSTRLPSQLSISLVPSASFDLTESANPAETPSLSPSLHPSLPIQPSTSQYPSSSHCQAPSLEPSATYRTTLAIRVVAADLSASASALKSNQQIFGSDNFSLLSQIEACSYENLAFLLFKGTALTGKIVSNGIREVAMSKDASETSAALLESIVYAATGTKYGNLGSQFDNVLFCLPPAAIL